MVDILKGPISIDQVAMFVSALSSAWYKNNYGGAFRTDLVFWKGDSIGTSDTLEHLSSGHNGVQTLYREVISSGLVGALQANAEKFVVAVNGYFPGFKSPNLKTRIINKTLLEDLSKGQIFPGAVNEFVITSWNMGASDEAWNSFVAYRSQLVAQAQKRINQSVSGMAYHMMMDLR